MNRRQGRQDSKETISIFTSYLNRCQIDLMTTRMSRIEHTGVFFIADALVIV